MIQYLYLIENESFLIGAFLYYITDMAENLEPGGKRKRPFSDRWLTNPDFQPWLEKVQGDSYSAWCNKCHKTIQAEITTIKRHKVKTFN